MSALIPVVIDTDVGADPDDSIAIALALASPELDVRGVTTVDGDVDPVTLLAFDDEIILEACCVWFVAPGLRNYVNHRIPRACLRYGWDCVPQKLALPGST